MGVDATIFVLQTYGPYTKLAVELDRDRDLWDALTFPGGTRVPEVQLPLGSWSTCQHGYLPEELEDRERGYVQSDAYDTALMAHPCTKLRGIKSEWSARNTATLALIAEHYASHDFIIYWH